MFLNKDVIAPITFSYVDKMLNTRIVQKIGNIYSPSYEKLKELVRKNMEYDRK